jgi:AcrR family transcriptional regulator
LKSNQFRRKREEARTEILDAAEDCLGEMDFNALSVDLVMRRTGMRRSSFYHHFPSLDDVALVFLERFERAMREAVEPWLRGDHDSDPSAATLDILTAMFEVMHANQVTVVAVGEAAGGSPRIYQEWRTRVLEYFSERSAKFIRRQLMRGNSTVENPERVAEALVLMNYAVFNANIHREKPDDPTEVARLAASIWNASIFGASSSNPDRNPEI